MVEIFFSQIREDSRVERSLQTIFSPHRVVCIGSGGCTAFSLLSDTVEVVYAVDINRAQCALIELKKAALQRLNLEDYLAFIGERPMPNRIELFESLKPSLPKYARDFWERRKGKINDGVNRCGVTERFYKFVGANLRENVCGEALVRRLFECTTLEEQTEIYRQQFLAKGWRTAVSVLFSRTSHLEFYPEFWLTKSIESHFADFFLEQFEKEISTRLVSNNYFLSQLLLGSYIYEREDGLPAYLTPRGFACAKRNLQKLVVVNRSLYQLLAELKGIDAFFLSNVFDWGKPSDRRNLCESVLAAKSKRALLLYRNMYSACELPPAFTAQLSPDQILSAELLYQERSMLYRRITAGMLG